MKTALRHLAGILILATLYILAAKLGLSLAISVKQITTVWPPSGLALAALLIYGYRLWPGVFVGAFVANVLTNEPTGVAIGIAIGNTLEAVVGVFLVQRVVGLQKQLGRVKDVLGLVVLAAILSTLVAATIGTTSLALGHLLAWSEQPRALLLWWFGDMGGDVLFAPFLLAWFVGWRVFSRPKSAELMALLLTTTLVTVLVFFGQFSFLGQHPPIPYLIFPFVIWAALRFQQHGVTAASLLISVLAVMGTVTERGPFAGAGTVEQHLIILLAYILLIAVSGLFMAAVVIQREEYALQLAHRAEELTTARNTIKQELAVTAKREQRLKKSHKNIIGILDQVMEIPPSDREVV